MTATSARVDVLTAEVRTLMVGSRQVTLSVYRQLDCEFDIDKVDLFGRVTDPAEKSGDQWFVGCHKETGALVRTSLEAPWSVFKRNERDTAEYREFVEYYREREKLPLIVLAGLR